MADRLSTSDDCNNSKVNSDEDIESSNKDIESKNEEVVFIRITLNNDYKKFMYYRDTIDIMMLNIKMMIVVLSLSYSWACLLLHTFA